ncbi:hypothetical protein N473_26180 [Pseudoalteromonas luteoviolacea CPMOR-1]|uniref:Uncharacterized protein n=1 Tax=Pseudoalteromonas luteoviolacea CPMOR-1 TaxID=1365248 RepID=A0A167I576_9GAMM|nr:hypothetical protein [Pseudoalteromonas luteoviolacea]KZN58908.1 hypothetical protein N473_26180 [Pseudoalteromonas luteoviolacea CPMOR-1]
MFFSEFFGVIFTFLITGAAVYGVVAYALALKSGHIFTRDALTTSCAIGIGLLGIYVFGFLELPELNGLRSTAELVRVIFKNFAGVIGFFAGLFISHFIHKKIAGPYYS